MSSCLYRVGARMMAPDGAQSEGVFHALNFSRPNPGQYACGFQRRGQGPINGGDYRARWRADRSFAAASTAVCFPICGGAGRATKDAKQQKMDEELDKRLNICRGC